MPETQGALPAVGALTWWSSKDGDGLRSGPGQAPPASRWISDIKFTLVAEMLPLTSTRVRRSADRTYANIITDAYPVDGAALIVERQLSVLVEPPGGLATLSDARNNRQTIIYRREPGAGR